MTGSVDSSSPTMKATRYVDIRMVSPNVTARRPGPAGSSRMGAVFEIAV